MIFFYQLEHQTKVIKLSMNKLLNTLNYTWVIKNNWLQYHTIHRPGCKKNPSHVAITGLHEAYYFYVVSHMQACGCM